MIAVEMEMDSSDGTIEIDSSGVGVEAAEMERSEIRMEERVKREMLMEERKTKKDKEIEAARAKTIKELAEVKRLREMKPKEPWENFRDSWNLVWGHEGHFASFDDTTAIPAMRFTHPDPDSCYPCYPMDTLQIISIKVNDIDKSLRWPLDVFGFIAIRDVLDHKRNILFLRGRDNCQSVSPTGPTRAVVVSGDPSYLEVKLKMKGATESEDKDLSLLVVMYRSGFNNVSLQASKLSTLELNFHHLVRSVEATISVKVIGGSWPDGFRGVFCASMNTTDDEEVKWLEVKLLDFGDDKLPVDADGMIKLSRRVVAVELEGKLVVSVVAYGVNKEQVADSREVTFTPRREGTSPGIVLEVGSCRMEVTVAWSLFWYDFSGKAGPIRIPAELT